MKLGLLLGANLYFCPYVKIYTQILDSANVEYDIIAWNRINVGEQGAIFYERPFPYSTGNRFSWLVNHLRYSSFISKQIKNQKYDKLIVFGPHVGLFILKLLVYRYKKKFCFDYRDIFIEQKVPVLFKCLLNNSAFNVISSNGFRVCLPKNFDYVLCHNFNFNNLDKTLSTLYSGSESLFRSRQITITTIGQIRDFEQNHEIMNAFCNNPKFIIKFIGKPGVVGAQLKRKAELSNQKNVLFHGFYEKSEEIDLLSDADFINIYYPKIVTHSTAISNRFYNALMLRKPMIVTKNSTQGDLVEKYKLGLAIDDCVNLESQILDFVERFDYSLFEHNCILLLNEMLADYEKFKIELINFVNSENYDATKNST